jgi:glycosyltransferase involved in cell wall biosynthesis
VNILILSWRGPGHPNFGGAEIVTHEHAKAWVKNGHTVTLFTSLYSGSKPRETVDGVQIIRAGNQSLGVHFKAFWWYFFIRNQNFDLVVDQFHGLPFFTPLYIRKAKKIAFIHEATKEVWRLNPWPKPFNLIPGIFGSIFEPLIFKVIYNNTPFLTVSESTKEDLREWGISKKNIEVIHNGVIIEKIRRPVKEKAKTVMFLGALSKDKGIELALDVFSKIHEKNPKIKFWVVGKGEEKYLKELKRSSEAKGLLDSISFLGFVENKKKFELLAKAHLLINPSVREGWGLVVIEAAAMGTPTIAFDVPGLRDSVIHNKTGFLVVNKDTFLMAEKTLELLSNEVLYNKLSKNSYLWGSKFQWLKSTKRSTDFIMQIYKKR